MHSRETECMYNYLVIGAGTPGLILTNASQ